MDRNELLTAAVVTVNVSVFLLCYCVLGFSPNIPRNVSSVFKCSVCLVAGINTEEKNNMLFV